MNEGEYLQLVNDLKSQYDDMKAEMHKEIAFYRQQVEILERTFTFQTNQFDSPRPMALMGRYTSMPVFFAYY